MVTIDGSSVTVATTRLKREEHKRTKHDAHFSTWKILIGPSDWEDHSVGKEGVARYRVHNLPTILSPGLYELGISFGSGKIDPSEVVVVYLGQADNVRNRIQSYGRSGSHLASGDYKGCQLFEEAFVRGFSVVFRWASMKDKRTAESTEGQMLGTFDYAWNKGSNGTRRPRDICQKLDKIASRTTILPNIVKKLQLLSQSKVGIKIEARKPDLPEKFANKDEKIKNFLPGVFKFGRSQPRLVSDKLGVNQDISGDISGPHCGFIMTDSITCKKPPAPGRKRCEEHKGKRIYLLSSKFQNVHDVYTYADSSYKSDEYQNPTCGVNLADGTFCRKQAVVGRKRCEEHKGMRVTCNPSKQTADEKFLIPEPSSVFATHGRGTHNYISSKTISDCGFNDHVSAVCGATLTNGSFCRRQPGAGNKRCWQHKGRRVTCNPSKQTADEKFHIPGPSSIFATHGRGTHNYISSKTNSNCGFNDHVSAVCGATLTNGSFCRRQPGAGNKRCWQHKGRRADSSMY